MALTTNDRFAVELYKIISKNIFNEIEKSNSQTDIFIFYSSVDDKSKVRKWVNKDFRFEIQIGENLGQKMSNSFKQVFNYGYKKVVIAGSDIPDLSVEIVNNAFECLNDFDVVISPSDDGGYSLLGMNNYYHELFENIEWSTNTVLEKTKQNIQNKQVRLKTLPLLIDIDTEDELKNWLTKSMNSSLIKEIKFSAVKEKIEL